MDVITRKVRGKVMGYNKNGKELEIMIVGKTAEGRCTGVTYVLQENINFTDILKRFCFNNNVIFVQILIALPTREGKSTVLVNDFNATLEKEELRAEWMDNITGQVG